MPARPGMQEKWRIRPSEKLQFAIRSVSGMPVVRRLGAPVPSCGVNRFPSAGPGKVPNHPSSLMERMLGRHSGDRRWQLAFSLKLRAPASTLGQRYRQASECPGSVPGEGDARLSAPPPGIGIYTIQTEHRHLPGAHCSTQVGLADSCSLSPVRNDLRWLSISPDIAVVFHGGEGWGEGASHEGRRLMAESAFHQRFSGKTPLLVRQHRPPARPLTLAFSPKKPANIACQTRTLRAPPFRGRGDQKTASSEMCITISPREGVAGWRAIAG